MEMVAVIPMKQWDVDHLAKSAFLYAFGRHTYAASTMIEIITGNTSRLSPKTRSFISGTIAAWLTGMSQTSDLARGWTLTRNALDRQSGGTPSKPSGLTVTDVDARIMFACAFRHDMQNFDITDFGGDGSAPVLWTRYATEFARLLMERKWSYVTARDLLNEGLVPSSEPLGRIPEIERPHFEDGQPDDMWLGFFRLMRDATENNREDSSEERR